MVTDLEKINEIYDDKINLLKDQIELSRNTAIDSYNKNFLAKENYRNRKRIEDINEIYEFYFQKLKECSMIYFFGYLFYEFFANLFSF